MSRSHRTGVTDRARITRDGSPPQYEATLDALAAADLTPVPGFFVRTHGETPEVDRTAWRLALDGRVRHTLSFSLTDLGGLDVRHLPVTLECAGNGRTFYEPLPPGVGWELGAVGTAVWSGIRLRELLEAADPLPDAAHVWFEAADRDAGGAPLFVRSVPIDKALDDVLMAFEMNHRPLTVEHGAPLRAIVPGWYAMASTKWVTRVRVEAMPAEGRYMSEAYQYFYTRGGRRYAMPVEQLRIKSLIVAPRDGDHRRAGPVQISGRAWGGRPVRAVEVSLDGGATWFEATLGRVLGVHAWRTWSFETTLEPGTHTLMSRAIDVDGASQPQQAVFNRDGYGWNGIHRVRVIASA